MHAAMTANWIVAVIVVALSLSPSVRSQIPTDCTDDASLRNLTCCPNNCGGRGTCTDVRPPDYSMVTTNVRSNWPHYFTHACVCTGNYAGHDCSRCQYGYYGANCIKKQILERKSIQDLTVQEWREYIDIMKKTRTYDSGYQVVLDEYQPGTTDINKANTSLYDLFVWQHHFAAKDSECGESDDCTKVDYAHEATGFPTWHRQFVLWFEWEIQWMLKNMNYPDYHTFRIHYWDWRREVLSENSDNIFLRNRLGVTQSNDRDQPEVVGDLFDGGWDTICWYGGSGNVTAPKGSICNPKTNTGPLLRCPSLDPDPNPCNGDNPNWPSTADVNNAIDKPFYDTESYNRTTSDESFRNFMEGFDGTVSINDCSNNQLCSCSVGEPTCEGDASSPLQRLLHNAVHIIVGIGHFESNLKDWKKGVMADVAASPNDPLFINHHGMIDCILEEWLLRNPTQMYPDVPSEIKGHQKDGYIVPFFPLIKHIDVFENGDNFGFSCKISSAAIVKSLNWVMLVVVSLTAF